MPCSMPSPLTESKAKRANLPRASEKDWKRLTHAGRYDMRLLKKAMLLLIANDGP